jgi:hypothetical protein
MSPSSNWKEHAAPLRIGEPALPDSTPSEDKTCQVNVHNVLGWELDPGMLSECMSRVVARHLPQAKLIDVYPQERTPADAPAWKSPGWCEWIIRIQYRSGGGMQIALIQRAIDGPYETHS